MPYIEVWLPPMAGVLAGSLLSARLLQWRVLFEQALPADSPTNTVRIPLLMFLLYVLAGAFVFMGFGSFFGMYSPVGFPQYLGAAIAITVVGSIRILTAHEGDRNLPNGMMIVYGADGLFAVYVYGTQYIRELSGLQAYGQSGSFDQTLQSLQSNLPTLVLITFVVLITVEVFALILAQDSSPRRRVQSKLSLLVRRMGMLAQWFLSLPRKIRRAPVPRTNNARRT